jgi:DNA-binding NarL/FixJ family response regulator
MGIQPHNTNEQDTLKMKDLTTRQLQVLRYIAEGDTNRQIALKLNVSDQTVRRHVYNLMKKLNARNRAHAVAIYNRTPRNRIASHLIRSLTTQDSRHTTINSN